MIIIRPGLRVRFLTAAFVLLASLAPAAEPVTLKLAHSDPATGTRQRTAQFFSEKLVAYTEGRYRLRIFDSGKLGDDERAIELTRNGTVDFAIAMPAVFASYEKGLNLTMVPYLVETYEQGWALYDSSKVMHGHFDQLTAAGLHFVAVWEAGFRHFTTTGPFQSPADAKGRDIRIFRSEVLRWSVEAIGFNPHFMPITEVYDGIKSGAVFGQENPISTIHAQRFFEVAPYVVLTGHTYSPLLLVMSEKTWAKLSPDDQDAVLRAGKEATEFSRQEVTESDDKLLKDMESRGAHVIRPPVAPFRTSVSPVYDRVRKLYGSEADAWLAEAEAARKAHPAKQ